MALVRLGVGHSRISFPEHIDWSEIIDLAERQGLSAIVLDGVEMLPESERPPKELTLQWIGEVLQCYEQRYSLYCHAIAELAKFYNSHGFKMMVLKGYICSLDWPKPEHRPCGDIDIWQFGKQKETDYLLTKEKGIIIDKSHHHHTVFEWKGFTVENHYDFINIYRNKVNREQEALLKRLGNDDSYFVKLCGEKIYIPSPDLHAFFLLRHMMGHFASSEISLRQVLDWAFFVEKNKDKIEWHWLLSLLESYDMKEFYDCICSICVENLGFDIILFPGVKSAPFVKDRVLNDILSPEFAGDEPSGLIKRILFKIQRWKANEWKHNLCYKESMMSSLINGVWNHLIKPSSI